MELHEVTLSVSVIANRLGRFYCGPLLLSSEVRLGLPDEGKAPAAYACIAIGQEHPLVMMNGGIVPDFLLAQYARQLGILLLETEKRHLPLRIAPAMPLVKFTQGGMEKPGVFNLEVIPVVRESLRWRFLAVASRGNEAISSNWQFVLDVDGCV